MFGLRFFKDSQNLRKKGQPPHHTTGVARSSSTYLEYLNCAVNPSVGAIAMKSSGALSTALTQRRRVRSRNSESFSTPPSIGTSVMPHFGHEPGPICTISGCIGQVYLTPSLAGCACPPFGDKYFSGSVLNACRQRCEQKW